MEKWYNLPILLNMSIGAVKITHKESFINCNCSIAMLITVVLFLRILFWVFLRLSHFDSQPSLIFAEVSESETERNTIRNGDYVGIFIALVTIIMIFYFY